MSFVDRTDAGHRLADRLRHFRGQDVVVLGLPRGGVPVAYEVARALDAPLDIIVVRKLGVPYQRELAMGAIGEGGVRVIGRAPGLARNGASQVHVRGLALRLCDLLLDIVDHVVGQIGQRPRGRELLADPGAFGVRRVAAGAPPSPAHVAVDVANSGISSRRSSRGEMSGCIVVSVPPAR